MGAILAGIAIAIVIAIGAGAIMRSDSLLSWEAYKTTNVRLDDPGSNLVGPRWSGENKAG